MSLFRTKITVDAHERAAEYVDGSLTRVLAPGRYRQPRRATYVRVHVLESIQQLARLRLVQAMPPGSSVQLGRD